MICLKSFGCRLSQRVGKFFRRSGYFLIPKIINELKTETMNKLKHSLSKRTLSFLVLCTGLITVTILASCNDSSESAGVTELVVDDSVMTETTEVNTDFEPAYQALRNRHFIGQNKELKCYYSDGTVTFTYNIESSLVFNNDSLVYLSSFRSTRPSVYRIREVTKEEDPYFDSNPKHYFAEFYTPEGELVRLTFGTNLNFESEDYNKDFIGISSKILDYNAVSKLEETQKSSIPDPYAPDAEVRSKQLAMENSGSRIMQAGITVTLSKENPWNDFDWSNPVPFEESVATK